MIERSDEVDMADEPEAPPRRSRQSRVTYRGKALISASTAAATGTGGGLVMDAEAVGVSRRNRDRQETLVDVVPLDWSRPVGFNIRVALAEALQTTFQNVIRLSHLKNLAHLLKEQQLRRRDSSRRKEATVETDADSHDVPVEHLLLALRCLLLDEEKPVRAACLRVIRHVVCEPDALLTCLRLRIDVLIARCLELDLENRTERCQALKTAVQLLTVFPFSARTVSVAGETKKKSVGKLLADTPTAFPASLLRPIVSLSNNGLWQDFGRKSDCLSAACCACLSELCVCNSRWVLTMAGVGWLLRLALGPDINARLQECAVSLIAERCLDLPLIRRRADVSAMICELCGPMVDSFMMLGVDDDNKDSEDGTQSRAETTHLDVDRLRTRCKSTLLQLTRGWPGLLSAIYEWNDGVVARRPARRHGQGTSLFRYLVDSLGVVENVDTREVLLELFCDLLKLPFGADQFASWHQAIEFFYTKRVQDEYRFSVNYGYVCAEAAYDVAPLDGTGFNLLDALSAITVYALIDAGLPQALVKLILVNPESSHGYKALLVLAHLLKTGSSLVPQHVQDVLSTIPEVIHSACEMSARSRNAANEFNEDGVSTHYDRQRGTNTRSNSIYHSSEFGGGIQFQAPKTLSDRLDQLSEDGWRYSSGRSLQMEMILERCIDTAVVGDMGEWSLLDASGDRIHDYIKESRILQAYSDPLHAWDWSLVEVVVAQLGRLLRTNNIAFQKHIEDDKCEKFLRQLIGFFTPKNRHFSRLTDDYRRYSKLGCRIVQLAAEVRRDCSVHVYLKAFLEDLAVNLAQGRLHMGLFSARNVSSSAVADYFMLIGQLTATDAGHELLEQCGILQRLIDLVDGDTNHIYIKLIISALDYSKPGSTRIILQKALTATSEPSRQYATESLRLFGRLKVADFGEWGIKMLLDQLSDDSIKVVKTAVAVLEELGQCQDYRDHFADQQPLAYLTNLGDSGVLLQSLAFGCLSFIDGNETLAQQELSVWKSNFNMRYAEIVDDRLCNDLTNFKRTFDGTFGRTSNEKLCPTNIPLPPHLYGVFSWTDVGRRLLSENDCVRPLMNTLQRGLLRSEKGRLRMKAALWAVGHLASCPLTLDLLLPCDAVVTVVKIAEECPYLSIRGVAVWALQLIGTYKEGAQALADIGWESTSFRLQPSMIDLENKLDPPEPVNVTCCGDSQNSVRFANATNGDSTDSDEWETEDDGGDCNMASPQSMLGAMDHRPSLEKRQSLPAISIDLDRIRRRSKSLGAAAMLFDLNAAGTVVHPVDEGVVHWRGGVRPKASTIGRPSSDGPLVLPATPTRKANEKYITRYNRSSSSTSTGGITFRAPVTLMPSIGDETLTDVAVAARSSTAETSGFGSAEEDAGKRLADRSAVVFRDRQTSDSRFSFPSAFVDEDTMVATLDSKEIAKIVKRCRRASVDESTKKHSSSLYRRRLGLHSAPRVRLLQRHLPNEVWVGVEAPIFGYMTREQAEALAVWNALQDDKRCKTQPSIEQRHSRGMSLSVSDHISSYARAWSELGSSVPRLTSQVSITRRPRLRLDSLLASPSSATLLMSAHRSSATVLQTTVTVPVDLKTLCSGIFPRRPFKPLHASDNDKVCATTIADASSPSYRHSYVSGRSSPAVFSATPRGVDVNNRPVSTFFANVPPAPAVLQLAALKRSATDSSKRLMSSIDELEKEPTMLCRHNPERCLYCAPKGTVIRNSFDGESGIDEGGSMSTPPRSRSGTQYSQNSSNFSGSTDDLLQHRHKSMTEVQKDIINYVCILDVRKRIAEQALLKLRQDTPLIFSSPCLYSDVAQLMAEQPFKLDSRRFIQELFQEVNLNHLRKEPLDLFCADAND